MRHAAFFFPFFLSLVFFAFDSFSVETGIRVCVCVHKCRSFIAISSRSRKIYEEAKANTTSCVLENCWKMG